MSDSRLKYLLQRDTILTAPAAFDMVSAKIIEKAGFEAVYLSGFGQSASHLGLPDMGLMTFTEMVERVHNMAEATDLPLICDGDTGYGGIINVRRTVREYEWAGASAIQLEDQKLPKKCGHTGGKQLVEAREMVLKIETAVDSRRDDDFLIIGRTDARTVIGFEESLRRGRMFEKAGADLIFIESPQTVEELKIIGESFEKPLMANMVEGGKTPLLSAAELREIGFSLAVFPLTCLLVAAKAMFRAMKILQTEGATNRLRDEMMPFDEFTEFIGFPDFRSIEAKYER